MNEWLQLAFAPSVRRRATRVATIVGVLLLAINHGDAIVHGDISFVRALRMVLTVLVPYLVSTVSSVGAIRDLQRSADPKDIAAGPATEPLNRLAC